MELRCVGAGGTGMGASYLFAQMDIDVVLGDRPRGQLDAALADIAKQTPYCRSAAEGVTPAEVAWAVGYFEGLIGERGCATAFETDVLGVCQSVPPGRRDSAACSWGVARQLVPSRRSRSRPSRETQQNPARRTAMGFTTDC